MFHPMRTGAPLAVMVAIAGIRAVASTQEPAADAGFGRVTPSYVVAQNVSPPADVPRPKANEAWLKKQVVMTRRHPKLQKLNETTGQMEVVGVVRERAATQPAILELLL